MHEFIQWLYNETPYEYSHTYSGCQYWTWDTGMHLIATIRFNEKMLRIYRKTTIDKYYVGMATNLRIMKKLKGTAW